MPLLEAMACAQARHHHRRGPGKDFCDDIEQLPHSRTSEPVLDEPPPLGPMAGSFTWFEPNFTKLVKTLRHVYQNCGEAIAKGRAAAMSVRHLTWQNVTKQYAARIRHLCNL